MNTRDPQFPPVLADIDSHTHAMSIGIESVVEQLVDLLGLTMVAAIGGVGETRAVQQWTAGREPQRPNVLRFALQLALMIATPEDRNVARAWFQGSNPHLGDRIPLMMLRNEPLEDVQAQLMAAARSFAAR
jgi:Protein of unknown function (DUF2384)